MGVHLGHPARPSHAAVHEGGELALGPPSPRLPQQLPVLLRDSSVQLDRVLLRELLLLAYALAARESRGPGSSLSLHSIQGVQLREGGGRGRRQGHALAVELLLGC